MEGVETTGGSGNVSTDKDEVMRDSLGSLRGQPSTPSNPKKRKSLSADPTFEDDGLPRNAMGRINVHTLACPPAMRRDNYQLEDFIIHRDLGTGHVSVVYLVEDKLTGVVCALKAYRKKKLTPLNRRQVCREIAIHSGLQHENVIELYCAFEDEYCYYLVLEYAARGDLFSELKRRGGQLNEKIVVKFVLHPFLSVLAFLHSKGIVHRDIKPENILFSQSRVLKMADFGLCINTGVERPVTRLGTLDYMAPEVLLCPDKALPEDNKHMEEVAYASEVDSWACGILAYELLVGAPPFARASREDTYRAILNSEVRFPTWMSDEAQDWIRRSLMKDPSQRPGIMDLLKHPWVNLHQRRPSFRSNLEKGGQRAPVPVLPDTARGGDVLGLAATSMTPKAAAESGLLHAMFARRPPAPLPIPAQSAAAPNQSFPPPSPGAPGMGSPARSPGFGGVVPPQRKGFREQATAPGPHNHHQAYLPLGGAREAPARGAASNREYMAQQYSLHASMGSPGQHMGHPGMHMRPSGRAGSREEPPGGGPMVPPVGGVIRSPFAMHSPPGQLVPTKAGPRHQSIELTPSIMHPHDPAVAAVGLTRMHPRAAKDSLPAIAPRGPSNGSHLPSPASTSAHSDADAATRRVRRSLQGLSLFEIPEGNGPSAPESGLSKSVGNDQPGAGMGAGGFPNPGMAAYGAPGGFSGSVGSPLGKKGADTSGQTGRMRSFFRRVFGAPDFAVLVPLAPRAG